MSELSVRSSHVPIYLYLFLKDVSFRVIELIINLFIFIDPFIYLFIYLLRVYSKNSELGLPPFLFLVYYFDIPYFIIYYFDFSLLYFCLFIL